MNTDYFRGATVLEPDYQQIDSSVAAEFSRKLLTAVNAALEAHPESPIILHFPVTEFIDSSGLSKMLDALRLCHARNAVLVVTAPHSAVAMLFRMVRLRQLTRVFDTLEHALEAIESD